MKNKSNHTGGWPMLVLYHIKLYYRIITTNVLMSKHYFDVCLMS